MSIPKFHIALLNFAIAATLGLLMRYAFIDEVPGMKYGFILNAHSHMAMLGWVYQALTCLLVAAFIPETARTRSTFNVLFWTAQFSVIGMLLTFPFTGYAALSIGFSTLYVLVSYAFAIWFFKNCRRDHLSSRYVRTALIFMIVSTLALWSLGLIMSQGLRGSAWYYGAIQFFLHFQLNGWFLFGVLGLFFHWYGDQTIKGSDRLLRAFHFVLVIGTVFTFALAVAWSQPRWEIFLVNSIGVLVQLVAWGLFLFYIRHHWSELRRRVTSWLQWLMLIALVSFTLKIWMQSSLVIPDMARIAYTIRNFVIGFLHLHLIGVVTGALFALALAKGVLSLDNPIAKWGMRLFLFAFLTTEAVLFLQGLSFWGALGFLPGYYEMMFGFSVFFLIGLVLLLAGQRQAMKQA